MVVIYLPMQKLKGDVASDEKGPEDLIIMIIVSNDDNYESSSIFVDVSYDRYLKDLH